jgi:hypothetical protein
VRTTAKPESPLQSPESTVESDKDGRVAEFECGWHEFSEISHLYSPTDPLLTYYFCRTGAAENFYHCAKCGMLHSKHFDTSIEFHLTKI